MSLVESGVLAGTLLVVGLAIFSPRKPFRWGPSLAFNAIGASCFAGAFFRFGPGKAIVAFAFIFGITTLATVARWWDDRRRLPAASQDADGSVP